MSNQVRQACRVACILLPRTYRQTGSAIFVCSFLIAWTFDFRQSCCIFAKNAWECDAIMVIALVCR